MPEKSRRYFLRDKEARILLETASRRLKVDLGRIFGSKVNVELVETEFAEIILINGRPLLAKVGENVYPTLVFSEYFSIAPKVVVDMGAIPFVCKGANVMAPGIRRFEGKFARGDLVFIVDEKHGKPIALGETLVGVDEAEKTERGIIINNIHFVGDRLWNFIKKFPAMT